MALAAGAWLQILPLYLFLLVYSIVLEAAETMMFQASGMQWFNSTAYGIPLFLNIPGN